MEKIRIPEAFLAEPEVVLGELVVGASDISVTEQITPASNHAGTQSDPVSGTGPRYTPGAMELTEGLGPDA